MIEFKNMMENPFKEYEYNNQKFRVYFVSKDKLGPIFGRAHFENSNGLYGEVRNDLNPIIQKFVIQHELYHLTDKSKFMGRFGMEMRANIISGFKNPLGLFLTILATLFSLERLKFYFNLTKK